MDKTETKDGSTLSKLERLAAWLKSKGRYRLIPRINPETGEKEKYLERFYLSSTKFLGSYLHCFWNSDPDFVHDHPWHFMSIILKGYYIEEVPERQSVPYGPKKQIIRKRFRPIFHTKYDAHRIIVPEGEEGKCWTLFMRFGLKKRLWGFYNPEGWTPAEVQSRKDIPE